MPRGRRTNLFVVILGCNLLLCGLSGIIDRVFYGEPGWLWNSHTLAFDVLPLALGAWCLRALGNMRGSGEGKERPRLSEVSHACGLFSGALLLVGLPTAVAFGAEPGTAWIWVPFLLSSVFTAVASLALAVAARRSRTSRAGSWSPGANRGWIVAALVMGCYTCIAAYGVWWGHRIKPYRITARNLYLNGLLLEMERTANGGCLTPGFEGALTDLGAAGAPAAASKLEALDGWGRPILYACSADGQHYEMHSNGANGAADPWSESEGTDIGDDLDQDVVFADGEFRRYKEDGECCSIAVLKEPGKDWVRQAGPN